MHPTPQASTLFASERRLRPLAHGVTYGSLALSLVLLARSLSDAPLVPWLVCVACSLTGHASNLAYESSHAQPTIGMIPVALFSLLPALMCQLIEPQGTLRPLSAATLWCWGAAMALWCLLALFVAWTVRMRMVYAKRQPVQDDAALIVLGGAIRQGRPCQTLARRLDRATQLWRAQPSRIIVVSGGPTPDGTTTEADAMARYVHEQGVARSSVLREPCARNTKENITYACQLLDAQGHQGQRCVVSSDYHLWRALRDGRKMGYDLVPLAAQTPLPGALQQWCREVLTILFGR